MSRSLRISCLVALVVSLAAGIAACSVTSSGAPSGSGAGEGAALPEGGTFRRAELLQAFGACAQAQAAAFAPTADALEVAIRAAQTDPAALEAARAAWRTAMDAWQVNELLQFGPGGPKARAGGKDLRDNVYSWPLGGRCAVEEKLVDKSYEGGALASALVNVRGLLALEYLLFSDATENACAPTAAINANGTWSALGPTELAARRLAYAHEAAALLGPKAREIETAWSPSGGNFLGEFTSAGKGSRTYGSDAIAFNVVSDSLFYLEYELKDMKLAHPLGLRNCESATCPEDVESPLAKHGKTQVRQNLVGARLLLEGCGAQNAGLGFDDMLVALGQDRLARDMTQGLAAAIAATDAIQGDDLAAAITTQRPQVDALYAAVKGVTDRLKTDFVSVLDLEIPRLVEGDND